MALSGDAACFVDPVFSTGVHLATYSGLLAARSINIVLSGQIGEQRASTNSKDGTGVSRMGTLVSVPVVNDVMQEMEHVQARRVLGKQHARWPAFAEVPADWRVITNRDSSEACREYVAASSTDLRPRSLRVVMGEG